LLDSVKFQVLKIFVAKRNFAEVLERRRLEAFAKGKVLLLKS